jgi:hypothetical protein
MTFFIDFFSCWTVFDSLQICKIFNDFVVREVKHIGDGNTEIKENR